MDKIIITKVDSTEPAKRKTAKSYPKSSLKTAKIKPVADPAKAPPTKKSMRKHTIRLFTNKGLEHHHKKIKDSVKKMDDKEVDQKLTKLKVSSKLPRGTRRQILEGAMIAGFVSVA